MYNILDMNENKSMDTHLDYLSSYKKIKESLSGFDKKNISSFLDYDSFLSLWHGKNIPTTKRYVSLIAPVFLLDKGNDIYIPFLVFHAEYKGESLTLKKILPMVNPIAIELLQEEGISPMESFTWSTIPSYLNSIMSLLETNKKIDSYSLEYGISFLDASFALAISVYPFLLNRMKGGEIEEKYKGLFQERKDPVMEEEIEKDNIGCFVRFERARKRLNLYKSAKISYSGIDVVTDVLLRFLDSFIEKKETVLLITPSSEKEAVRKFLSSSSLNDFVLDYDDYNLENILSIIDKEDYHENTYQEDCMVQSYELKRDRYLSFEQKKEECFSLIRKRMKAEDLSFILQNRNIESKPFSISDYTEEDYKKDNVFLSSFHTYDRVISTYLENHPFYGLSADEKRETFDSLQLLNIQILNTLKDISQMENEDTLLKDYGITISNLSEYQRVKESFALLSEYNGFPKKYFRTNKQGEKRLSLPQLKLRYQALSSSTLLVSNIMDEKIFEEDISSLLHDYQDGNLFQKTKAKRKIVRYLKVKRGTDMKTVIRILTSYEQSKRELERVLPDYRQAYGDNVNTMNGVMEIESNIRYIERFNRYSVKNPNFTLEHPFVKRYLKDKDFRQDSQKEFKELSSNYQKLMEKLSEFNSFFRYRRRDYLSFDLNVLNDEITLLQKQDYESYRQYSLFITNLYNSSKLLQSKVHEYVLKKKELIHFTEDFRYSIFLSLYQMCEKSFSQYQNGYETAKKEYEDSLSDTKEVNNLIRYQNLKDNVLAFKADNINKKAGFVNKVNTYSYNQKERIECLKLLFALAPISLGTIDNIPLLDDSSYDHVIILDSGFFSNEELLDAFRLGKDVLLLNDHTLFDSRTQFYHQTLINKETLYQKAFDFDSLNPEIIQCMKDQYQITGDDVYPFIATVENKRYALLPNCLLTVEHDIHFVLELATFLAEEENLTLTVLDVLELLLK